MEAATPLWVAAVAATPRKAAVAATPRRVEVVATARRPCPSLWSERELPPCTAAGMGRGPDTAEMEDRVDKVRTTGTAGTGDMADKAVTCCQLPLGFSAFGGVWPLLRRGFLHFFFLRRSRASGRSLSFGWSVSRTRRSTPSTA